MARAQLTKLSEGIQRMHLLTRCLAALLLLTAPAAWAQIKIGVTLSLTGPAASLGIPERDTIALLPREIGAHLVLIGDGPMRDSVLGLGDGGIHAPGYIRDRSELARWLASADIYVSGMADETFGVSIVEAQASALPVVGVAAGAMVDRVTPEIGRLGPVDDARAMARNILDVWSSDRTAMGEFAQLHARQYSWDRSMSDLFTSLYPKAFRRAWARAAQPSAPVLPALADALVSSASKKSSPRARIV
jgi:hypothetical protein